MSKFSLDHKRICREIRSYVVFMVYIATKIDIFSSSDDEDDESIEETNVLSNKSEISSKSIEAKMYTYKILKISFRITFSGS